MTLAMPPSDDPASLDDASFARIARIARTEAGLALNAAKRNMIGSRIAKRLRATGHRTIAAYLDTVEAPDGQDERRNLIDALTTNVSHFFREEHHFEFLRTTFLPSLAEHANPRARVRLWSAGCSTGQEAYSIAMTVREVLGDRLPYDLRILATDIDGTVLDQARRGIYRDRQLQGLSPDRLKRHFRQVTSDHGAYEVRQELRDMIAFRRLNLIADWPLQGPFEVIFCRNVVIYFDADTQARLWPRFRDLLAPGGVLFLGHSERLTPDVAASMTSAGVTAFRRPTAVPKGKAAHPTEKEPAEWQ